MRPHRVVFIVFFLVLPLIGGITGGCASRSGKLPAETPVPSFVMLPLDEVQPDLVLPEPVERPLPAPSSVLSKYAQGRSALLDNRKSQAIEYLTAVVEEDPYSAVAYRDLGYAWLGTDNDRALSAYKQAVRIDPEDTDSRVQLARLYALKGDLIQARNELLLARLTTSYHDSDSDSVVVDLLLGRVLSETGYIRASIDCFEKALQVLQKRSLELRSRTELIEVIQRPAVLKLKLADLYARIGSFEKSLSYYEQIQKDEPQAAGGIELRMIQTRAKAGDITTAARQMAGLVIRYQASRASLQAFIDLFENHGGEKAALSELKRVMPQLQSPDGELNVLQARLLRRLGRSKEAGDLLVNQPGEPTMSLVRETVMSLQESDRTDQAVKWLLQKMNDQPRSVQAIFRGWAILNHLSQPHPFDLQQLRSIQLSNDLESARHFVLARWAQENGQPVTARQAISKAHSLDAGRFAEWLRAPLISSIPDVNFTEQRDVRQFIEEFSNDPVYLNESIGYLVQQGQASHVQSGLEAVLEQQPENLVVLELLTSWLESSDRSAEAIRLVDRAASTVRAAPMLYKLSGLYTRLGVPDLAEKMLRRSLEVDPNFPPACNDLGYLLADSGRELDFAESLLYRAVGLEPENPAYIDSLGWLLYKQGKFEQARPYLERAISFSEPPDPIILDHAGDAAYRDGDKVSAEKRWNEALSQIRQQGTSDPQLRLKIERKIRQLSENQPVDVAEIITR